MYFSACFQPFSSSGGPSLSNTRTTTMSSMLRSRGEQESLQEEKRPLLGYDWIASILDNEAITMDQSDRFLEDIKEFRRVNREECEGEKPLE